MDQPVRKKTTDLMDMFDVPSSKRKQCALVAIWFTEQVIDGRSTEEILEDLDKMRDELIEGI